MARVTTHGVPSWFLNEEENDEPEEAREYERERKGEGEREREAAGEEMPNEDASSPPRAPLGKNA